MFGGSVGRTVCGLVGLMLILGLTACGDDGGGSVDVSLQEWSVNPDPTSVSSGEITINVDNTGEEVHEFVIISTDLDPGSLPTVDDGSVSEDGEGMEVVDEIEDIDPGTTSDLTVDLEAGSYVFLCNIYEEADSESHYQMGMRTAFTVE